MFHSDYKARETVSGLDALNPPPLIGSVPESLSAGQLFIMPQSASLPPVGSQTLNLWRTFAFGAGGNFPTH